MGVVIGTAGHIDHGKSRLVQYLTGEDPDRLKEERERGITIELGYVFMPIPGGGIVGFIDVPGHENFVRQMVAGTATVDRFLMVVAADEGIMPQTREHLDIVRLLGVEKGLVAMTKCDLVDDEMQELVEMEIRDYLKETPYEGTPVFRVSSLTGEGMDRLRKAIVDMAAGVGERKTGGAFRLDIDRVFVLEGFGTIVAGTVISGTIRVGREVEIQPGGRKYRVRDMRVNARKGVPLGIPGDRVALNLVGLRKEDVYRGCCVAEPGYMKVRNSLDTKLSMVPTAVPLKRHQRVRFHTGTAEVMARAVPVEGDVLAPGTTGYVHFQLESPVAAIPEDRFVIRSYSPIVTIGGGKILETGTRKVRKKYVDDRIIHLEVLEKGDLETILDKVLEEAGRSGLTASEAASRTSRSVDDVIAALENMAEKGMVILKGSGSSVKAVGRAVLDAAREAFLDSLSHHHSKNPLSPGIPLSEPARILNGYPQWLVRYMLDELLETGKVERRGDWLASAGHPAGIPAEYGDRVDKMLSTVESMGRDGFPAVELEDENLARALVERGLLLEMADGLVVTSGYAERLMEEVRKEFGDDGFALAQLRDFLGGSRKEALRWAELFDALGWTVRRGNKRYGKKG